MQQISPQKSDIMVFAGAGASAGLDIPTTPQFISLLKNRWEGMNTLIQRCLKYIQSVKPNEHVKTIDSEVLRDWLISLRDTAEDLEIILENQPFDTSLQSNTVVHKLVSTIITELDLIIRETYSDVDPMNAHEHYAPLLDILSKYTNFIPFFTTNYDLVLESMEAASDSYWNVERGIGRSGVKFILNQNRFGSISENQKTLHLFKLHGSTDWWKNNQTGGIEYFQFGNTPSNIENYMDLLIYPTREKFEKVNDEPFSFFYNMLASYLNLKGMKLCIVIGYSFRDKKINELFIPAIESGLRLVVIDNRANHEDLNEQLNISDIESKIRIVKLGFGKWNDTKVRNLSVALTSELSKLQNIP